MFAKRRPTLGGVLASTRLSLGDEIVERQRQVVGKIELFNAEAASLLLSLADNGFHREFRGYAPGERKVPASRACRRGGSNFSMA